MTTTPASTPATGSLLGAHPSVSTGWLMPVGLAAVFVLGMLFATTHFGLVPLLAAVLLLLCLGTFGAIAAGSFAWLVERPPQAAFLLLTAVLLGLLYAQSTSPDSSFVATWTFWLALLFFALLVGLDSQARERCWRLVVGVLVGLALFAALQLVLTGARASWPVGDPNNYASVIYIAWIPLVHRALAAGWSGRGGSWLPGLCLTALAILALFATESRAGFAICVVAFLVWWALALWRRFALRLLLAHTLVALGVFAAALLIFGAEAVAPGGGNTIAGGAGIRLGLISSAWQFYVDRPVLGAGLNTFALFYALGRPLWDQQTAGRFVHNDYAQLLMEGGPLLLLALLVIGLWSIVQLVRLLRAGVGTREFAAAGFALAACALLAHALVNFVFYLVTLTLLLALLLSRVQPAVARGEQAAPAGARRGRLLGLGVLLAGWTGAAYLALDVAVEGVLGGNNAVPFTASARQSPAAMQAFARRAAALNPRRGLPLLADAALTTRQLNAQTPEMADTAAIYALSQFRQTLAVDPWNTNAYLEMYRLLRRRPDLQSALSPQEFPRALLQRALALNRRFVPAIDELLILSADKPEQEARVLRSVVAPWLELIARQNLVAGERYLAQLAGRIDDAEYARLRALLISLRNKHQDSRANAGWRPGPIPLG
ncbi:MAG: O-antigen ligase family protein [Pseudomonadota bacterium]